MAKRIKITAGSIEAYAELSENQTAEKIWSALPFQGRGSTWGDEIYFSIPVNCDSDEGRTIVDLGDLGYWPPGNAFCIFFGPTPMSRGNEIRPASAVNVFGKIEGDPTVFKQVSSHTKVLVEKVEDQ